MKNGIFNIIRGIAFCFVLSIICLFGRVEAKADTYTGVDLWKMFEKHSGLNWSDDNTPGSYLDGLANVYSDERCNNFMYLIAYDSTREIYYLKIDFSFGKQAEPSYVYQFCQERNYKYIGGNYFLDNDNYLCTINANHDISTYSTVSGTISVVKNSNGWSWTTQPYMSYAYQCDFTVMLSKPSDSPSSSYDSTLGYLDNCIRKCMNQLSYSDSNGGFHSIVDVTTDKLLGINSSFNFEGLDGVDCYHWLDKTTSGKSFDSVEVYISLFKEGSLVKENSFILGDHPLYYDVSWRSLDSSISGFDLLTRKYTYQIWLRPLSANSYGDWVYFDCQYNRVSERIQSLVSHILDTDIIGTIDDFKLTVENCQFGTVQGDYKNPSDVPTSFIVPNVLYNGVYTQLYKPTITDDDKDNILQQIPDSSTSYTDINNNITIIQNGGENGESLLDKFGDLLSFCKNFLTFLYNFINLILSPLSFLPGWLKTLISTSIIAFIVICVIKTLRG